MGSARKQSVKVASDMFEDVPVLRRKWQAGLRPGETLPHYEDVMLGSLGRLADHIVLLKSDADGFAVSRTGSRSRPSAMRAARLIRALSAPYTIDGNEVVIGASIGIAMSPSDGTTGEELMRNADIALYRAKQDGRGVHRFFEREMDHQVRSAARWRPICAAPSPTASSSCTTSRWSISRATGSPDSSRCCAGAIPRRA
jgi:hypothetical protein